MLADEDTVIGDPQPAKSFTCPEPETASVTCGFEDTFCAWRNEKISTPFLDWETSYDRFGDPAPTNTPFAIMTAAQGAGILISKGRFHEMVYIHRVISGQIGSRVPNNTRLDFWYHMWGTGNEYLQVLILEDNRVDRIVWERDRDQGTWGIPPRYTWTLLQTYLKTESTLCRRDPRLSVRQLWNAFSGAHSNWNFVSWTPFWRKKAYHFSENEVLIVKPKSYAKCTGKQVQSWRTRPWTRGGTVEVYGN